MAVAAEAVPTENSNTAANKGFKKILFIFLYTLIS